jgi:selenocysteine lyase/cysteine desulfurase
MQHNSSQSPITPFPHHPNTPFTQSPVLQLTKETVIIRFIPNAAAILSIVAHDLLPRGTNMFDKSKDVFPIKDSYIYLAHCGVSPLYSGALKKEREISRRHQEIGGLLFSKYFEILNGLRIAAAKLMKTSADNLAFVKNTSEGMNMIANGYRFQEGDQIITYMNEYPANYYPWKLQERCGVELVLLPDRDITASVPEGRPGGWSMADLEALVTNRTRILALSHVQFTSGFAVDLKELGEFCQTHGIDLVVDAAQSLGALPVYPEEYNISAIVSSGWKWLMGPLGTGLMYTSPGFRTRLRDVMAGAELMVQGTDYLNHSWHPHHTAKRFEYSTAPISLAAALEVCITDLALGYTPEKISAELFRLQDLFVGSLDRDRFTPLLFSGHPRSTILPLVCKKDDPNKIEKVLLKQNIVCSSRGGYLRVAPHFYNTMEEIHKTVSILNSIHV